MNIPQCCEKYPVCKKKYKAHNSNYVPCILKYVPCNFASWGDIVNQYVIRDRKTALKNKYYSSAFA